MLENLEDEFDGEDACEDEIEVVEDRVAGGALVYRVFGGQRDAAGADDDHNEQIEVTKVDDEVTETTNSTHEGEHRVGKTNRSFRLKSTTKFSLNC